MATPPSSGIPPMVESDDSHESLLPDDSPPPPPPQRIPTLRPYQREGVRWLIHNFTHRRNVLLGDEMGMGKTVQALSFLKWFYAAPQLPLLSSGLALVICPLSTVLGWMAESKTWLLSPPPRGIACLQFVGPQTKRNELWSEKVEKECSSAAGAAKIVVVTTYEIVLRDRERFFSKFWDCVVFDEAHRLRNRRSRLYGVLQTLLNAENSRFSVFLSGTPVQNSLDELFSMLHLLDPVEFPVDGDAAIAAGGAGGRGGRTGTNQVDLTDPAQMRRFHERLRPYLLRRMRHNVMVGEEEEGGGGGGEAVVQIVPVELTSLEMCLCQRLVSRLIREQQQQRSEVLRTLLLLQHCCDHPFLLQGVRDAVVSGLLLSSSSSSSSSLSPSPLLQIRVSGKLSALDERLMLQQQEGGKKKGIILTKYVRMLDLLEEYFHSKKTNTVITFRIDGSMRREERSRTVDQFASYAATARGIGEVEAEAETEAASSSSETSCVLLASTRVFAASANTVAADFVVFYDSDINPSTMATAVREEDENRVIRSFVSPEPGRAVTILRLLTPIELKIRSFLVEGEISPLVGVFDDVFPPDEEEEVGRVCVVDGTEVQLGQILLLDDGDE